MTDSEMLDIAIGDLVRRKNTNEFYIVTDMSVPIYYITITCCARGLEFASPARDYEVVNACR